MSSRVSGIFLSLLLIGMLTWAFSIESVKAPSTTIIVPDDYPTIQEAINPANDGDTIFVKAGAYSEPIQINKALTLLGENKGTTFIKDWYIGVYANNVRISDFTIENLWADSPSGAGGCVYILGFDGLTFSDNIYIHNWQAIRLIQTSGDLIINNYIDGSSQGGTLGGIGFDYVNNTIMRNNTLTNCGQALSLSLPNHNNTILENNITMNSFGIVMNNLLTDNRFYHNNVINNNVQVYTYYIFQGVDNTWDNGYPSGGNYWSDYAGVDAYHGPSQNIAGSDGIGDTPYTIDAYNIDHYPLMKPYVPFENQTIYIRADGSVDPSGAPIMRKGDLYNLTASVTSGADGIVIERDNMTFDGGGHSIHGNMTYFRNGIALSGRTNVTIVDAYITNFYAGIKIEQFSSNNTISRNEIVNNTYGLWMISSSYCTINSNQFSSNAAFSACILFHGSPYNTIAENKFDGGSAPIQSYGIDLEDWSNGGSDYNVIVHNIIANFEWCLRFSFSFQNKVYHNNLMNYTYVGFYLAINILDDGYPSGGNYWSGYTGRDLYSGPYQNKTGGDGIGDTSYVFDAWNIDHYPLMKPWFPISWELVFTDAKRGTMLKISTDDKYFWFTASDKDFGIKHDPNMKVLNHITTIRYQDSEMLLTATAIDDRIHFCLATAYDKQTHKSYLLIYMPNSR